MYLPRSRQRSIKLFTIFPPILLLTHLPDVGIICIHCMVYIIDLNSV